MSKSILSTVFLGTLLVSLCVLIMLKWAGVPAEPPQIVDTYLIPTKKLGNGMTQQGGRLLVVQGIDGMGKPYRTEMLVFSGGRWHGLKAMNVIYWPGASVKFNNDGNWTTGGNSGL